MSLWNSNKCFFGLYLHLYIDIGSKGKFNIAILWMWDLVDVDGLAKVFFTLFKRVCQLNK